LNKFVVGDRVRISVEFFWARGASGTIARPLQTVTGISGEWEGGLTREETSALGTHTVYWINFDEPQYDADEDGPYRAGSIWEEALTLLTRTVN
jgi:hypothetical protein